jgi:predicted membrane protein
MENNSNLKRRENGRVVAGLILVGVGAVLLLRNTGYPLPNWLFSWPIILILVGIYTGIKHNFRNNAWLILITIGCFFLFDRIVPDLRLAPYFWPVLLIALGIIFILRPRRRCWTQNEDFKKKIGAVNTVSNSEDTNSNLITDNSEYMQVNSIFSGIKRNIVTKNFQGGKISCVFGGADIDLSQAEITGDVVIKFEVVFGGAKLIVPPHWTVQNEVDGVFHGVDDKRRYNASTDASSQKRLILKGSAVFGGIEIRSY